MTKPNNEEYNKVCKQLEEGQALTLQMLGRIFGEDFWILVVVCMSQTTIKAENIKIEIKQ